MMTFQGYRRRDSRAGIRNWVAVVSTISCANHVVDKIAASCPNAIAVTHETGCLQFAQDRALTERTIRNMGLQPNAGAVLFVGLGCEQIDTKGLAASITGRPAKGLLIQEEGGTTGAITKGSALVQELNSMIQSQQREEISLSELVVGLKCGGSDYTTALFSNPALGIAMDMLKAEGGTCLLTETTGFPGAEHVLAERARTPEVARQIWRIVDFYRDEIREKFDLNVNDGNPSPGNIAGGITTLVEKALGTIKKGGTGPVEGVIPFGEICEGHGLYIMDTPGHDVYSVSGAAAGGAQLVAFTTGRGSPLGCALAPTLKITASYSAAGAMRENIDVDLSAILDGMMSVEEAGQAIFEHILRAASGGQLANERLEHFEFAIPRIGSTL